MWCVWGAKGKKGKNQGKLEVKVCLDSGDWKGRGGGDEYFFVQRWKICWLSPGVHKVYKDIWLW